MPARPATPGQASGRGRGGRGGGTARSGACLSRRGWPAGSTVPGWSRSTAGPSSASNRSVTRLGELQLLARSLGRQRRRPSVAQQRPGARRRRAPREAIRRPMYSSSVPAIASGTIGAPVRSAISAAPLRNGPIRPAGPLHGALGHLGEHRRRCGSPPARTPRAARCRAPPRHTGSSPPSRWMRHLAPARGERGRGAAEEPGAGLERDGVDHDERVHPAAVGRADEQVAARRAAGAPGRWSRSGTGTARTARTAPTSRSTRYRIDAFASGSRPSHSSPSRAPPAPGRGHRLGREPRRRRPAPAGARAARRPASPPVQGPVAGSGPGCGSGGIAASVAIPGLVGGSSSSASTSSTARLRRRPHRRPRRPRRRRPRRSHRRRPRRRPRPAPGGSPQRSTSASPAGAG